MNPMDAKGGPGGFTGNCTCLYLVIIVFCDMMVCSTGVGLGGG